MAQPFLIRYPVSGVGRGILVASQHRFPLHALKGVRRPLGAQLGCLDARLGHFDLTRGFLSAVFGLPLALLNLALRLDDGRFPRAEYPFTAVMVGGGLRLGAGEVLLSGFNGGFEPLAFVL